MGPATGPAATAARTVAGDAWLRAELQRHFKHPDFRPLQAEVIRHVLARHHALAVMPTGSGKSLCYQLPALLSPGLTVVVSPLIALMRDQVEGCGDSLARCATFINSSLSEAERRLRRGRLRSGQYRLLYVSPERLGMGSFLDLVEPAQVWLLVVDEAHCISEWGHDFRPSYLGVRKFAQRVGRPTVLAVTATATERVRRDISRVLDLGAPREFLGGLDRPNLSFEVWPAPDPPLKAAALQQLLGAQPGPAIIYVGTRRDAEDVAAFCRDELGVHAEPYHAGMDKDRREEVQGAFTEDQARVVVATCAFGMGIDKPDVRLVVHLSHPGSLETYYQEAGRAGRDGEPARCVLLYSPTDRKLQEYLIRAGMPSSEKLADLHARVLELLGGKTGWVDTETLQQAVGMGQTALRVGLSELAERHVLELLDARSRALELRVLVEGELSHSFLDRYQEAVERRNAQKQANLARMVEYCETSRCRRAAILRHFDQAVTQAATASCCDRCAHAAPPTLVALPSDYQEKPTRLSVQGFEGWALGYYRTRGWSNQRSEVGKLVFSFKYEGRQSAGRELARRVLALLGQGRLPATDLCLPVPHTGHGEKPGAAVELAHLVADLGGPPADDTLLRKTRQTSFQKGLHTLAQKRYNVDGAFEVARTEAVCGKRILLLDDLFDSGATMAEAAKMLRIAGAAEVHLLAAARVSFGAAKE